MTRIPYSPSTDATPRDSDLDLHAHCRARDAALRAAIEAADRLAALIHGQRIHQSASILALHAAYLAAREETR